MLNSHFAFIGGGNMAEALIRGLISGGVDAASITVAEPVESRREHLRMNYGVTTAITPRETVDTADILILAVKPQVAPEVFTELGPAVREGTLVISVMAGVSTSSIERPFVNPVRVIRVMPNTPALALEGATAIAAGSSATFSDIRLAEEIFGLVGKTWVIEEKLMDAVTGLSGSGPAYVLTFIEALADAGVKNGLPRDTALGIAIQTVLGSARLLQETGEHPAILKEKVTSPGGTTIAGLYALESRGFRGTVMVGVDAAVQRSRELGGK